MTEIMYVCDVCFENSPEHCGRFDRNDLRVTLNGQTLCDVCHDEISGMDWEGYGYDATDDEFVKPDWSSMAVPPEFKPVPDTSVCEGNEK